MGAELDEHMLLLLVLVLRILMEHVRMLLLLDILLLLCRIAVMLDIPVMKIKNLYYKYINY